MIGKLEKLPLLDITEPLQEDKDKTKMKEYNKIYYQANKEKHKQYYQENRDKILERAKQKTNKQKPTDPDYFKKYREQNKDRLNAYLRNYRKNKKNIE